MSAWCWSLMTKTMAEMCWLAKATFSPSLFLSLLYAPFCFFFVRSFSSNKNNGSEIGATEEEVESVSFWNWVWVFALVFGLCCSVFFFCLPSVVAERQTKTMIYVGVMAKKNFPPPLFRSFSVISLFFPCVFLCVPCFWAPLASVFFFFVSVSPLVLPFSSALFSVCVLYF